jgi:hypothetical protein
MWSSPANWRKTKSKPPHFVFTYVDYPDPAYRNRINRFDTKFRQVDTASIRSVHPRKLTPRKRHAWTGKSTLAIYLNFGIHLYRRIENIEASHAA